MNKILLVILMTALGVIALDAQAHRFAPSLLRINETDTDQYRVLWKTPQKAASATPLQPLLPDNCVGASAEQPEFEGTGVVVVWNVECSGGIIGKDLSVSGLAENRASIMAMIELADGRVLQATLSENEPRFTVPERASRGAVFTQYLVIGMEHILGGLDHLLFVLGLLVLVGTGAKLLWTVTAFTLGHSVTLSLAALGYISFPVALIEFAIAFSIFVVALEIVPEKRTREGLIQSHPWWLASGFGLLHGMGFAGALTEIGLPAGEVPMALFSFNVGIEIGQIAFLLTVVILWKLCERVVTDISSRLQWAPAYILGSLSVMWCFERMVEAL